MAKIRLDRLRTRYGWTGGKYKQLMTKVLAAQAAEISADVVRLQKAKAGRQAKMIKLRTGMQLVVPEELAEAFPARSLSIRKAAERGKLLADNLRARLAENLRGEVVRYLDARKPLMQGARGEKRGRMNKALVDDFERQITRTFASYAQRDPEIGVPANVRTIADTEVRSAISLVKNDYAAAFVRANPDKVALRKRWKHHPELSKEPRPGHREMNGKMVAMDATFSIPQYERAGTIKSGLRKGRPRWRRTGRTVAALHPHDPALDIGETANCHCEADYVVQVLPQKKAPAKRRAAKSTEGGGTWES
jgi:hypothetical protein